MKAKVIYIIATATLTLLAFFIGKFTAPTVIKTETPTVLQTDNSDIEMHMPVFLENGEILLDTQWNGEEYLVKGKSYSPFYKETEEDTEIIGYYED